MPSKEQRGSGGKALDAYLDGFKFKKVPPGEMIALSHTHSPSLSLSHTHTPARSHSSLWQVPVPREMIADIKQQDKAQQVKEAARAREPETTESMASQVDLI